MFSNKLEIFFLPVSSSSFPASYFPFRLGYLFFLLFFLVSYAIFPVLFGVFLLPAQRQLIYILVHIYRMCSEEER